MRNLEQIHNEIETRLEQLEPDVELVAVEEVAAERLRLTIDRDLLVEYSLEVSSPGPQRPLTKPDHFRRFLGRRARVRTRQPLDGHKSFTGELVGASDEEVTVAADGALVSIPYTEINRSNLVEEGR
jgi:ribosome maturation factor RimP